jgi:biopolymer transport protein ExbB/TolQ
VIVAVVTAAAIVVAIVVIVVAVVAVVAIITTANQSAFRRTQKNSLSEDFLLAKHKKDTNIPTMIEPFSSPVAWF